MILAQLNAEADMEERHDVQRTAHLMLAIDALNECWNGVYDTKPFIAQLRRTAARLNTLAEMVEKADKTAK